MQEHIPEGILFARQPIHDRKGELVGYELLFRPYGGGVIDFDNFDGSSATSQVLLNAFTASDFADARDRQVGWVNFTADTLMQDLPFSPEHLIVEVLEDVEATRTVVEALVDLKRRGYRLALDDYRWPNADHPLLSLADIVKLEYPAYDSESLSAIVDELRQCHPHLQLLAEKIETRADHRIALEAGCDLFQGYFMAHPEPVQGRAIPVSQLNTLELLTHFNRPNLSVRELVNTVRQDPFISVRLLRLANSVWAAQARPVHRLHDAVLLLGEGRIRSLASLLVLARFEDKPNTLQRFAMLRGHFCRELAEVLPEHMRETGFTVGLYSMLDSFLDLPMEEVLEKIPVSDEIHRALLHHEGEFGVILEAAIHYQYTRWELIDWGALAKLGLGPERMDRAWRNALRISNRESLAGVSIAGKARRGKRRPA
ncbi:EAL and HDOD domain-containing protein [Kushneria aurantia]|uniref:EAL and HDOD domain-containing protein n=1 Tax=Kushneria aurantia TaxID=504092 RepID=A0ABV6G7C2_9GAMM|nr:HDOD domain-containing protein [Kushneria aurantia]